ncbi:serine/threonine protein phosphatase [Mammaliicoccus sciuri]|uniref:metallophosphoesterase n=1 Tax=Mammaliicoccus sciuri TaxID=1296 RepID=UPI000E687B01|nr:metallophosphoesterase [Mammaliicoccus sciuri]RIO07381.1 serine/threonine protein phosphatase [Mammaliicoccus sciuri]
MNISYINDLHIDHWVKWNPSQEKYKVRVQKFVQDLIDKSNIENKEVMIIAGDISHFNFINNWVLEVFNEQFEKTFVVTGNHDYYLISKNQKRKYKNSSMIRAKEMSELIDELSNVVYFHSVYGTGAFSYKGKVFAGITMTSLPETDEEKSFYQNIMNDSKYITSSPESYNSFDMTVYKYLKNLNIDVFISHYPLVRTYSHNKHLIDGSLGSYLCRVDEHIAPINFFGHVHEEDQLYEVLGTKHYTNALGYPQEKLGTIIRQIKI